MRSALLALVLVLLPALAAQDPGKNLKAKEFEVRLAAVDSLSRDSDPKSEKLLHSALRDEDWEVVERAARGLAEHGTTASVDPLGKLALDGPVRRIRRAAAVSLAKIAARPAADHFLHKASSADAVPACEALEIVLRAKPAGFDLKPLRRIAEKDKDATVRAAAGRALLAGAGDERGETLARLLDDPSVEVQSAALDLCIHEPRADCDAALLLLLHKPTLSDLLERRALRAMRASFLPHMEDAAARAKALESVRPLLTAKEGAAVARGARLIGLLAPAEIVGPGGEAKPSAGFDRPALLAALQPALGHPDAGARAAAVKALSRIGGDEAAKWAREIGGNDKSARVRFQGVDTAALLGGAGEDTVLFLAGRLASDVDPGVREEAAVHLGRKGSTPAVEPLVRALSDKEWSVAACAAVSLGKTQSGSAIEPLSKLARGSADWKLRGAAVAGLSQIYLKSAIPAVIPSVADADPCVARTAQAWLATVSHEKLPPKVEAWNEWWAKASERVLLVDPEAQAAFKKRLGDPGTAPPEVYRDLDLVVLESRGDHIEKILGKQKIEHRLTAAGKVGEGGLHPDSLFVANCTGEIEDKDVERLRWFVLCGGRLFGSCWALHETIERAVPGVIRKFETASEVLDNVPAAEAWGASPYAQGVFGPDVQPIYALQGAHLIEVLDPERAEVLVDSPECAEKWGSGDLAAWFTAGHGTVLDSVNHFDVQGLELAVGLKTKKDRMAYAVDHMGLSYAELRASQAEKYWDNNLRASEKVLDLSVFRLVTNFVRRWRLEVGR